jgi:HlyD family secretion protein
VEGKKNVLQKIKRWRTQDAPIVNEAKSIDVQIAKINDQIEKSKITNPIKGTVLAKYAEQITAFGSHFIKLPIFLK